MSTNSVCGTACDHRCFFILESVTDAVHIVDKDLRIIFLNDAFKKWVEELGIIVEIGQTIFEAFPFLSPAVRSEYIKVMETRQPLTTKEFLTIGGAHITTETTKIPNTCNEGSDARVITIVRNTTQLTDTFRYIRLDAEKHMFQQYLDVAAGIVLVLTKRGKIELLNKRGCDILGCVSEEMVLGKDWFETFLPEPLRGDLRIFFDDLMAGELQPEGDIFEKENAVIDNYGVEHIIRWRNILLRDEEGTPNKLLSYGTDVTGQRRLEHELRTTWKKAEKLLEKNIERIKSIDKKNGNGNGKKAREALNEAVTMMLSSGIDGVKFNRGW